MVNILFSNENIIDTWECIYDSASAGSYQATLVNTNERIIIKFGRSMSLGSIASNLIVFQHIDGIAFINKKDISSMHLHKGITSNYCCITLKDGSKHVFDKRMLSATKMAESLTLNTSAKISSDSGENKITKTDYYSLALLQCSALLPIGLFCFFKTMNIYSFDTIWDYIWVGFKYICFGGIFFISGVSLVRIALNYKKYQEKKPVVAIIVLSIFFLLMLSGLIDQLILFSK